MKALLDWLDNRTGYRQLLHEGLYENVPGGARWRYVTGSMLVFAFFTQVVTGIFLWMAYSPGTQNAWESVYYIQFQMQGGYLLRGLHHYMAQAMVVLLPLHLLQVVIDGAYRAPREINYWLGLILMLLVLALGLTGYLLPWDQKGYWATKVATNLIGLAPLGSWLQKLVVGSSTYGQHTLTRFFALHAGVLPALLVIVLTLHLALFRRFGLTAHRPDRARDQTFWPHQVLKDALACAVVLAICVLVIGLRGTELGAPADPTESYQAARPEWYFLFLFQLLKKFRSEFVGAIVVPGLVFAYLAAMPILARWRAGHLLNVLVILGLVGGAALLTAEALYEDRYAAWFDQPASDATVESQQLWNDSRSYLDAVERGEDEARRSQELAARHGIPLSGMRTLIDRDPEIQGPRLFAEHCASCHTYRDPAGNDALDHDGPSSAPNLFAFGSRQWLQGFLRPDEIVGQQYFGGTAHAERDADGNYPAGRMVEFVHERLAQLSDDEKKVLEDVIVSLSAEAALPAQRSMDGAARDSGAIERGRTALAETFECTNCHRFHEQGELGSAPDLTGWGSTKWLQDMIGNPGHARLYGPTNDRMPSFAGIENESAAPRLLSDREIGLLAAWIRGDER